MRTALLIIDPQNDFCIADDGHGHKGTLVVPGADKDMSRLAEMIRLHGDDITPILVTLDNHQDVAVERPAWWKRVSDGAMPLPFTVLGIHPDGKRIVKVGTEEEYTTSSSFHLHHGGPRAGSGSFEYLEELAEKGKTHVVWPAHCGIGDWGSNVVPELRAALREWSVKRRHNAKYIVKGTNPYTEHFSGVRAEVPDSSDPSTQTNFGLTKLPYDVGRLLIAGEARTHCVANTVLDMALSLRDKSQIEKMVLLTDATSDVPGFEHLGEKFMKEMTEQGMQTSTTTECFS